MSMNFVMSSFQRESLLRVTFGDSPQLELIRHTRQVLDVAFERLSHVAATNGP